MFGRFFGEKAKGVLRSVGYLAGSSALVGASVFSEERRRKALQEANPDCDVVTEWRHLAGVFGYNKFLLKPKEKTEKKEPAQSLRRP